MMDEKRKLSPEARITFYVAIGTVLFSTIDFYARGADLLNGYNVAGGSFAPTTGYKVYFNGCYENQ